MIATRDHLLTTALRMARVVPAGQSARSADISLAADLLHMILESLQGRWDALRTIEREYVTLVASTGSYALPSDTIDIKLGPNGELGTILNTGSTESQVFEMSRAEYDGISDKTATGLPTRAYVEKLATITVYLWPVPDSTCSRLYYRQVRAVAEATGGAALDMQKRGWRAVMTDLAAELARSKSMPMDLVASLRADAERLYQVAEAADVQHGPIRCVVTHRVNRWS